MAIDTSARLTADEEQVVRALLAALRHIRFGSVQISIQDGRVVQIDTLEKQRLTPGASPASQRTPRSA